MLRTHALQAESDALFRIGLFHHRNTLFVSAANTKAESATGHHHPNVERLEYMLQQVQSLLYYKRNAAANLVYGSKPIQATLAGARFINLRVSCCATPDAIAN